MQNNWKETNGERPSGLNDTDLVWLFSHGKTQPFDPFRVHTVKWSDWQFWQPFYKGFVPPPKAENPVSVIEAVDHPAHYNAHPSGIECIDVVRHMNFNCGNAIKYIWRAGEKDPTKTVEDLKKAVWYLNDEIERLSRADRP